mmetsp:Transcript_40192/g.159730  ORF Transcript_40192/g.159730 Transcript_40192/m.159730 type:complete len:409 (-) Transcript_40192:644-1870(-)
MTRGFLARAKSHAAKEFMYHLPSERIACQPLGRRDSSKLLVAAISDEQDTVSITHRRFSDIARLIPDNALLVLNDSKVIQARLPAAKATGGKAEILLLRPSGGRPPSIALQENASSSRNIWTCMVGGKKLRSGSVLKLGPDRDIDVEIVERVGGSVFDVRVGHWNEQKFGRTFGEVVQTLGSTPLPPYIRRKPLDSEKSTYQTVYAKHEGSVAAPTAGLHLSPDVLEQLVQKGVETTTVTLHIGAGTFAPISGGHVGQHTMHAERIEVETKSVKKIVQARKCGRPIVAVGTTAVRTLESLYWCGLRILRGLPSSELIASQWEPYMVMDNHSEALPDDTDALEALIDLYPEAIGGETQLLIVPGYNFRTLVNKPFNRISSPQEKRLWHGYRFYSCFDPVVFLSHLKKQI